MKPAKFLLPLLISMTLSAGAAMAQTTPDTQTRIQLSDETPRVEVTTTENNRSGRQTFSESRTTIIGNAADADDDDTRFAPDIPTFLLITLFAFALLIVLAVVSRRRRALTD